MQHRYNYTDNSEILNAHSISLAAPMLGVDLGAGSRLSLVSLAATPASS